MALSCCCCCVASCHTQPTLPPWGQASVWIPLHPPPSHTPMVEVASSFVHKSNQPESYRCWFVQRLPTGPEHAQRIKTLWGKLEPKWDKRSDHKAKLTDANQKVCSDCLESCPTVSWKAISGTKNPALSSWYTVASSIAPLSAAAFLHSLSLCQGTTSPAPKPS